MFQNPCHGVQLLRQSKAEFKRKQGLVPDWLFLSIRDRKGWGCFGDFWIHSRKTGSHCAKGIVFFRWRLIKVEISSILRRQASFIIKTGSGGCKTIDFIIVVCAGRQVQEQSRASDYPGKVVVLPDSRLQRMV